MSIPSYGKPTMNMPIGTVAADCGAVIRYETHGDELVALREKADGERFYQLIRKGKNFTF